MFYFNEKQRFRQWWIWVCALLPFAIILFVFFMEKVLEKPVSDHPVDDSLWPVLFLSTLAGSCLLLLFRLDTTIDREKVTYRFFPFHFKPRELPWTEIESAYVREYKPIQEYGGWGIRQTIRNGKAFNIRGNQGLQLVLKNGKKILIGTQKIDEIQSLLLQLKIPGPKM